MLKLFLNLVKLEKSEVRFFLRFVELLLEFGFRGESVLKGRVLV